MKIGPAFGDYIRLEQSRNSRRENYASARKNYKVRSFLLPLFLILVTVVLFARLFFLQIVRGSDYRHLSDGNRIKTVIVHAPRGIIFDRQGIPLVFNVPGFREKILDKTKLLTKEEAISIIASGRNDLEIDSLRSYPYKDAFSHVLGYISQISKEELLEKEFSDYKGGDLTGKMGIEQSYEKELRGIDGKKLVEVDNLGKDIRKLGQKDPISGGNITLTLDLNLQKAVFNAVKDVKKGVAIVSTPKGEILALISKPSFDTNLFTMGDGYKTDSSQAYKNVSEVLLDSADQPFLDRAISGTYPPGSTFKLVVAAAGLQNKIIDENFQVEDTGVLQLGAFSFSNWYFTQYGGKDGSVDVVKGIKRSNDIFFYKLAEKVGADNISNMAKKFGIGSILGIDLAGEAKGVLPTPLWKEKTIGQQWFLGDTYHYGIGQGYLLVTPLQVNVWTQAIANGGIIYKPHLLKNPKSEIRNPKFLSEKTVSLVKEGMVASCSTGGVAWPLFELKINPSTGSGEKLKIACKTGTAEHGGKDTVPHAWITLFAPADKPQIIVTVLSESSGEGSNVAAPIAKKILEEWLSR